MRVASRAFSAANLLRRTLEMSRATGAAYPPVCPVIAGTDAAAVLSAVDVPAFPVAAARRLTPVVKRPAASPGVAWCGSGVSLPSVAPAGLTRRGDKLAHARMQRGFRRPASTNSRTPSSHDGGEGGSPARVIQHAAPLPEAGAQAAAGGSPAHPIAASLALAHERALRPWVAGPAVPGMDVSSLWPRRDMRGPTAAGARCVTNPVRRPAFCGRRA